MGYRRPAGDDVPISASWQSHKDRTPPSSEPGTDYACAYGSVIVAAGAGVVEDLSASNAGAPGRYVAVQLDDGRTTRDLHMAELWVARGQRVSPGTALGLSGASGYGSDWYYGPHVHATLWPGQIWAAPTIDFEDYAGAEPAPGPAPGPATKGRDQDMSVGVICTNEKQDEDRSGAIVDTTTGLFTAFGWFAVSYADGVAKGFGLERAAQVTRTHYNSIQSAMAALASRTGTVRVDLDDEDVAVIGGRHE